MPPAPFHPPPDAGTYRDLLLFEERLKTNAARLKRTKTRYQIFLGFLIFATTLLASEVLLDLDFMLGDLALRRLWLPAFPYLELALLLIAVTTLILFFATGTYTEKIAYANKYVAHANRSLRSFNMYLNVRAPPLLGVSSSPKATSPPPTQRTRRAKSQSPERPPPVTLTPIPPASNPRGELIFSSRVNQTFRDGYDRYRTAFERRREEKERANAGKGWLEMVNPWAVARGSLTPTTEKDMTPSPLPSRRNSPAPVLLEATAAATGTQAGQAGQAVGHRGSLRSRRGKARTTTQGLRDQYSREQLRTPSPELGPPLNLAVTQ